VWHPQSPHRRPPPLPSSSPTTTRTTPTTKPADSAQRIAEARASITAYLTSVGGALDTDITLRAAHDNATALTSQEAELRKRTGRAGGGERELGEGGGAQYARAEQAEGCAELGGGVGAGFVGAGGDAAGVGRFLVYHPNH
jgi:hypothetical protein